MKAQRWVKLLLSLLMFSFASLASGKIANVSNIHLFSKNAQLTQVELDMTAQVPYKLFTLNNPKRVVIDFSDATISHKLKAAPFNSNLLKRIRSYKHKNKLRMVFDVSTALNAKSAFVSSTVPNKLKFILKLETLKPSTAHKIVDKPDHAITKHPRRNVIVAIDAGHGGKDPGAIGYRGTKEKDVNMAIAKHLYKLIKKAPGMKPLMVRKDDTYIRLKERVRIARDNNADLFISIHADSFNNRNAQGSSVFILSENKASSSAAKWLAERENHADFIGGLGEIELEKTDKTVASVLLDLSLTSSLDASEHAAEAILGQMKKINKLHQKTIQKAGFLVLKAPDVPSVLIETAFLSNPHDEKKLRSKRHQKKIARSIFKGIQHYFRHHGPTDSLLAQNTHQVTKGESLSMLAQYYDVDIKKLKKWNQLSSNTIKIGQVLKITPTL